jgi:cytochrome c5
VKVCSGCHKPEAVLFRRDTPKNWAKKVDSMINRGAEATDDEIKLINTYLNNNFAFVPEQVHFPDGPGKAETKKICGACHPAEIVVNRDNQAGIRNSWGNTIDRMSYKGIHATPDEVEAITDYLVKNFGYIPVPTYLPDGPGKQTTERVCGPCHGVGFFADRSNSRAGWRGRVSNMVSRGAIATPAEQEEIANYLGQYLGPKPTDK